MNTCEQDAMDTLGNFALEHDTTVIIRADGWILIHNSVLPPELQAFLDKEPDDTDQLPRLSTGAQGGSG